MSVSHHEVHPRRNRCSTRHQTARLVSRTRHCTAAYQDSRATHSVSRPAVDSSTVGFHLLCRKARTSHSVVPRSSCPFARRAASLAATECQSNPQAQTRTENHASAVPLTDRQSRSDHQKRGAHRSTPSDFQLFANKSRPLNHNRNESPSSLDSIRPPSVPQAAAAAASWNCCCAIVAPLP